MSKERMFDIFNFTKPKPDKLIVLNKSRFKSNSDNDSESVDSDLLNETVCESTSFTNVLKDDETIDLGDLQSGPIRPVLKVIIIII